MKSSAATPTTTAQSDAAADPTAPASKGFLKHRPRLRRLLFALIGCMVLLLIADRVFPPALPIASGSGLVVNADDGRPLRAFASEGGVWRMPVTLEEVSPLYIDALLAYEDRWFWRHPGINPASLARASWQALANRRIVSGGSTLTMQVARILDPPAHRRSALGKLRQALRALQLEWRLSKREILELYLNHAPFGGTIEGVAAASWAYLGKPPSQLSHAEAALLAVLPQAPSRNRPDRHAERARVARDKVIGRLRALGEWDATTADAALQEPVVSRQLKPPVHAALLAERLRRGDRTASKIDTLIDADLQMALEQRVENALLRLPPATSAAVLVVENETLAVRAYVGSGAYADPARLGHVDMVVAQRSPGSTLKPFVYGMAIDDGLIHSASLLVDAPQSFDGYRPANFDQGFRGPVTAADALRLSLNVPAVDLLDRVGPPRFSSRLAHAGVTLKLPRGAEPNLSMILGGTSTSLESLVGAYTALGRSGMAGQPRYRRDEPIHERRLFSAGAAFIVREMLREPAPPGTTMTASRRADALVAKTGTSWGYRDAWAIGLQPGWTLGVWIGRPDGTPMPGQYGAVTALPLLKSVASMLPRRNVGASFAKPNNVEESEICWPLGVAPDPDSPSLCARKQQAWILDGVIPATLPDRIAPNAARTLAVQLDAAGRRRRSDCADSAVLHDAVLPQWPILAEPWLDDSISRPPAWAPGCERGAPLSLRGLDLNGLHEGTTLKPAPGGDGIARARVTARGGDGDIWWLIDDQVAVTSRDGIAQMLSFPRPGSYRVLAVDRSGNHASVRVRVLP